jgi:hypothetical protein
MCAEIPNNIDELLVFVVLYAFSYRTVLFICNFLGYPLPECMELNNLFKYVPHTILFQIIS